MKTLQRGNIKIAYHLLSSNQDSNNKPCIVFCGGFHSNMQGIKATTLEQYCDNNNLTFIRFDYSAHGQSSGSFAKGCISEWLDDTLAVIDQLTTQKTLLIGSSMGGWLSLLAALQRPQHIMGLLLIACAVDMTRDYPKRTKGVNPQADKQGQVFYATDNQYDKNQPYRIYQHLLEDAKQHYLLDTPIKIDCPIHLIHGQKDDINALNNLWIS